MKTPDIVIDSPAGNREKIKADAPASYETAIVACGYGKFHYMLMLAMVPMCASQLFSSGAVSFVMPTAKCDLQLEDFQKGTLNAATYLGNIASGLVWGGASDIFGRRQIITCCFLLDFFVSVACSFAHTYWLLLLLKILAGAIIAGPNSVLYAYLAETHDDKHRGMAIMGNGLAFAIAQLIQPVMAYFLLPLEFRVTLGLVELTSWRVFLLLCALPSLVSALLFLRMPESPKFLMGQGQHDEALRVFTSIYCMNTGRPADSYPVTSLETAVFTTKQGGEREGWLQRAVRQFRPLFHKSNAPRLLILIAVQLNIMLCINSLRLWTPQLFAFMDQYERGVWDDKPSANTACQMISAVLIDNAASPASPASPNCTTVSAEVYRRSIVIGCTGTLAFVVSGWAIKRLGNRTMLLTSFLLALVTGLSMLWAANADVFMGLLAVFTPLTGIGLTALSSITVDLFPTSLRGMTVSIALISGRVASLSGNLILPVLLNISCEAVFIFVAVCMTLSSVFAWFLPTKGLPEN